MMDEKKLGWLMQYLDILSKLESNRINEETRAIQSIENELGINPTIDGNLKISFDQVDKDFVHKLTQKIYEEIKFTKSRYK